MATKKHDLTTGKDNITGKGGVDLFLGGKGELGSDDVLNGGGGIDTISAELSGKHLAPVMKGIEKGIFSHHGFADFELDLLHAQQMTRLAVRNFQVWDLMPTALSRRAWITHFCGILPRYMRSIACWQFRFH